MKRFILPLLLTGAPLTAHAQAWVPTTHSIAADVGYTFAFSKNHVYEDQYQEFGAAFCGAQGVDIGDSNKTPDGGLHSHIMNLGIDYTPPVLEGLGIRVSLPIVTSRYLEEQECEGKFHRQTPGYYVDDNEAHTSISDVRTDVRYMIDIPEIITITPGIGFSVPTWDYPLLGHASVGRGLWELSFGVSLGKAFTGILSGLYLHGRYQFGLAQSPEVPCQACEIRDVTADPDVSVNRSYVDFEIGYFVLDWLSIRALTHWQTTHGGVAYLETSDPDSEVDPDVILARVLDHDALRKEMFLLLGGGVAVTPLSGLTISAIYQHWITGYNTHDTSAFSLTLAYQIYSAPEEIPEYVDPFEGMYEDEEE